MTNDVFMELCRICIALVGLLMTAFVIPFIKTKISESQLGQVAYYCELAVRCAEQIYPPEKYEEKKEYVVGYMRDVINEKLSISLTDKDINAIVEGVVNEVKRG